MTVTTASVKGKKYKEKGKKVGREKGGRREKGGGGEEVRHNIKERNKGSKIHECECMLHGE